MTPASTAPADDGPRFADRAAATFAYYLPSLLVILGLLRCGRCW